MNASTIRQKIAKNEIAFVSFQKKNGEIRNMICTTNLALIPKEKHPSALMHYDESIQVRVFDIVAQEWRSMIPENVITVEPYISDVAEVLIP